MAAAVGPVRNAIGEQAITARRNARRRIAELLTEYRQLCSMVSDCDAVLAALGIETVEPHIAEDTVNSEGESWSERQKGRALCRSGQHDPSERGWCLRCGVTPRPDHPLDVPEFERSSETPALPAFGRAPYHVHHADSLE